jgi:hypothetical protein
MTKLLVNELDGKKIAYSSETIFLVQVGKGPKGSYKTRYTVKGSLGQAAFLYVGINIGNGYKKRLVMPSSSRNRGVLARQASFPEGRGCSYIALSINLSLP